MLIWKDDFMKQKLFIDTNGIFYEYNESDYITREDAIFMAEERARLAGDKKLPLLIEFEGLKGFSPLTREMPLDVILANVSALAYYTDIETEAGRETRNQINLFFSITPWPIPVKIMTSEKEAIEWLKGYRD